MVKKVLNVTFWVVLSIVFAIWIFDYINVKTNGEPKLCLHKETHKFDDGKNDGTVEQCTGLGYRVYKYDTENIKGIDFASIFTKMKR